MPYDGNGNYAPPAPPTFPAVNGEVIRSDYFNTIIHDAATALTTIGQYPSQAEAEAGVENTKRATSLRVKQAISAIALTLAVAAAPGGSALIGYEAASATTFESTVQDKLRERVSVRDYGAIGDGTFREVAQWIIPGALGRYANLAALQVDYPHVTATTDSLDWAAIQKAIDVTPDYGQRIEVPRGNFMQGTNPVIWPTQKHIILKGCGSAAITDGVDYFSSTQITYTGLATACEMIGTAWDTDQISGQISNLSWKGSGFGSTSTALDITWASGSSGQFSLKDLFLYEWGTGVRLDAVISCSFWNVTNRNCGTGWDLDATVEAINSNTFYFCNDIVCGTGVRVYNSCNNNNWIGGTSEGFSIAFNFVGDANAPNYNHIDSRWLESAVAGCRGVLMYTNPINPRMRGNTITKSLFTSEQIGVELDGDEGTIIQNNGFFDTFIGTKLPVQVGPNSVDTQILDNDNWPGNNDYSYPTAGAGLVIRDVIFNIRRVRHNNSTQLIRANGRADFYNIGENMRWAHTITDMTYAQLNTATANPRFEMVNGAKIIGYSDDFTTTTYTLNAATGVFDVTGSYHVDGVKVVGNRKTGWGLDTGTAKRTTNATYTPGAALTFGAAYVEAEADAVGARLVLIEDALRDATQTIKALKDDLEATTGHGLLGA